MEKVGADAKLPKRSESPLLSVVVPTHDRPSHLRACLDSLISQTSRSFEVVVVLNGSPKESRDIVLRSRKMLPELKTVTFDRNIWDWNDLRVYYRTIYGAGLDHSVGDYILFLSDDDAISSNFVEAALNAFSSNSDCVAFTGAASDTQSGEQKFSVGGESTLKSKRVQLEDGIDAALRYFSPSSVDKADLADPGFGYVVKTDLYRDPELQEIIWSGGYEVPQYLALIPNGSVAFDATAKFFWGRHPDQANRLLNSRVGMLRQYEMIRQREMRAAIPLWRNRFGVEPARMLEGRLRGQNGWRTYRFLWETHVYDANVVAVLGRVARSPLEIFRVGSTDARHLIFWVLLPRALMVVGRRALRRFSRLLK